MDKPTIELGPPQVLLFGIGGLIFYFARTEHWIDGMVATIFERAAGAKQISKIHPTTAAAELCFLRRSFSELAPLQEFRELGLEFVAKIEEIAPIRHGIAHGHLRLWDQENDILEFSRLRPKPKKDGGGVKRETLTVSSTNITAAMLLVRDLSVAAQHLTQTLTFHFGTKEERGEMLGRM